MSPQMASKPTKERSRVGTFDPTLWYDATELEALGISGGRLREWQKPKGKGGEDLRPVKLKKFLFWGGDIHEILLSKRSSQ